MIEFRYADGIIDENAYRRKVEEARGFIEQIEGDDFGGWMNLPEDYDKDEFAQIKDAARCINENSDYLVCIGIGGSYLGHRAVIEALGGARGRTKVLYAGNSLSARSLREIIDQLGDADFSINVISKSGTTTEPAVAFRIFRQKLIEKYGEEEAARRIFATTDVAKGALHDEAVARGYERFVVPNNIGGRYSVLTGVGLLAIAVAGIDIDALMAGAAMERMDLISDGGGAAAEYAAMRNLLLEKGYDIEILANFEPQFMYFNEWWKQLFGESEGKDHKGIFPASVIDSTDLHSMGQYIQEGRRNLFETFVEVREDYYGIAVPVADSLDGLEYLEGCELDYINKTANEATRAAHLAGGVPVLEIIVSAIDERSLGALIYFFEMSCALSGFTLGVNPFNQPGVEAYKNRMFELLGKPGYEK